MRMLALPAALLLGALLYSLVPQAEIKIPFAMNDLHKAIGRLIHKKTGKENERMAYLMSILIPAAAAFLLELIHPAVAALVMAPLFSFFALMPEGFAAKRELDSGKYVKDREAYENRVVHCCEALGEALVPCLMTPILLCAVGMPLHLGGALGWTYAALRLIDVKEPLVIRILALLERAGDAVAVFLLHLCAGLFGRNPLRIGGEGAEETLLNLLGLEGENDHAPISGDISQSAFACCLCAFLLCAFMTLVGMLIV